MMDFYAYQRPVGRIEDLAELRDGFIAVFDERTKKDAVRFGLLYGKHLIDITGIEPCETIDRVFEAMRRWLDGEANYHEARSIAFDGLYRAAREENDDVKLRYYKTMAQVTCIPHVKFHALWATDFAITLINRMYPGDLVDEGDSYRSKRSVASIITCDSVARILFPYSGCLLSSNTEPTN